MKRLSKPLSEIDTRYDAIVVGSGYGGGMAASRLARMGYRVALLERGEELHPGEYPGHPGEGPCEQAQINAPGRPQRQRHRALRPARQRRHQRARSAAASAEPR